MKIVSMLVFKLTIICVLLLVNTTDCLQDPYALGWTSLSGNVKNIVSSGEEGHAIAVDQSGYVYLAGKIYDDLDGEIYAGAVDTPPCAISDCIDHTYADMYLIKYNFDGTKVWTRMAGTSKAEWPRGVAIDSTGSVIVTGQSGAGLNGETYNGGSLDAFLIKYASDGTVIWTKLAGSSGEDIGYGVQVDSSDNVFVCGSTDDTMSGPGNVNAGGDDNL